MGRTWGSCKPVVVRPDAMDSRSLMDFSRLSLLPPTVFSVSFHGLFRLFAFLLLVFHDVWSLSFLFFFVEFLYLCHNSLIFFHIYISIKKFSKFIIYITLTRTIFSFFSSFFSLRCTIDTTTVDVEGRRHCLILTAWVLAFTVSCLRVLCFST